MKTLVLNNGNLLSINSIRYAYDKCIFTYTIWQRSGYWKADLTDSYTMGYYDSVEDFLNNKHN
jgi:hypothetical protein